jgi:hypothetical protein
VEAEDELQQNEESTGTKVKASDIFPRRFKGQKAALIKKVALII